VNEHTCFASHDGSSDDYTRRPLVILHCYAGSHHTRDVGLDADAQRALQYARQATNALQLHQPSATEPDDANMLRVKECM
jgi:hypothetical protein